MANTTVLFVPGAWHSGQAFAPVADLVRKSGYTVHLLDLPSVGPEKHVSSFAPDVAVIRQHISDAVTAGQKVAIVAHSYGGIPVCEAAKDFTNGEIIHLFFLSSFIIPENSSLIAAFGGNDLPWFLISDDRMEVNPDNPEAIFYNDLSPDEAAKAKNNIKPQSYQVMHSPLTYAAWKHLPSTYLYCTRDAAIPLEIQKMMVEGTAKGVAIRTEEVDAGHSPFMSKPQETADAIVRAVQS